MKQYLKALVERIEGKMVAIATDETVDRQGDSLKVESWDFKNFKRNPVLLWAHDYHQPPIGAVKNLKQDGKKTLFEPVFHELTQLSREIKAMYDEGFMSAFSVGFLPHDNGSLELLEVSAVPVPANPKATVIQRALDEQVSPEDKMHLDNWLKSFYEEPIDEPICEVKQASTEVQSVICFKTKFESAEEAKRWIVDHDFRADKIDETEDSYRFRQFSPSKCDDGTERTIELTDGVKAVICRPKGSADGELRAITLPLVCVERLSSEFTATNKCLLVLASKATSAADKNAKAEPSSAKGREPDIAVIRHSLQLIDKTLNNVLSQMKGK